MNGRPAPLAPHTASLGVVGLPQVDVDGAPVGSSVLLRRRWVPADYGQTVTSLIRGTITSWGSQTSDGRYPCLYIDHCAVAVGIHANTIGTLDTRIVGDR